MKTIKKYQNVAFIFAVSFLPVFLVHLPFMLHVSNLFFIKIKNPSILTILANWDGPNYLINAQTLYDPVLIGKRIFTSLPLEYFATHLPFVPILIFTLKTMLPITAASLLVIYMGNLILNLSFYIYVRHKVQRPLLVTLIFGIVFPRLLVVRSVLSAETYAIAFLLLFLHFFSQKKYLLSSIFAIFCVLTKFQLILLLPALVIYFAFNKKIVMKEVMVGFAIAASFILLFAFYYLRFSDFFVYFNSQRANGLSLSWPYSMFDLDAVWAGTHLVEVIVFYLACAAYTCASLAKRSLEFGFCICYTLLLFVTPHADIPRYFTIISPFFVVLVAKVFYTKSMQVAIIAALPAIYFYTINYIQVNVATINNWSLLLK